MGAPAPDFQLESIDAEIVSLEDLLRPGRPALLVFSDAHCDACRELAPDLARWQREHDGQLTLAVIASGGADANRANARANGINRTLLQFDGELRARYEVPATPSAVLVAPGGKVASPVAAGPEAIRGLVERTVTGAAAELAATRLDSHFDDAARALAHPVGRRRALAILTGTFAALLLPSLRPRRAYAGHNDVCPLTSNECECTPASADCRQTTCSPGYRCCWEDCTNPNGCTCTNSYCCWICDPDASQCGPGPGPGCAPGPIAPECCGQDSRLCGNGCCPNDSDCCQGKCCSPGQFCNAGECQDIDICTGSGNRIRKITQGSNTVETDRPLFRGEILEAGDQQTIYEFENGTRLKLRPGTKFRTGPDCFDRTAFEEFVGKVWADVKKTIAGSDAKFNVQGNNFIIGVRGTSFSLEYEPERKRATLKVTSGSVEMRGQGKARGKVIVKKGQTAVQQGKKPPKLIKD